MTEKNETLVDLLKRAQNDPASLTEEERDLVLRAIAEVSTAVLAAMAQIGQSIGEALAPVAHVFRQLEETRRGITARMGARDE